MFIWQILCCINNRKIYESSCILAKIYKQVWEIELSRIQEVCDTYVKKYTEYLATEKDNAFQALEKKIDSLGVKILGKLFSEEL